MAAEIQTGNIHCIFSVEDRRPISRLTRMIRTFTNNADNSTEN